MVERISIGNGVFFTNVITNKFKTNTITFNFILPLNAQDACKNAIIPFMLKNGFKDCEDVIEFNKKLKDLYDADIFIDVQKFSGAQNISIGIKYIKNKYTIGNENIAAKAVKLLLNTITEPIFDNDKIFKDWLLKQQKLVLSEDISSEFNDKDFYAKKRCLEVMFEGTNCAVSAKGTVEEVNALSALEVTKAYLNLLNHAQVEIVCIGGEQENNIAKEEIAKTFELFKNKERIKYTNCCYKFREQEKTVTEKMKLAQSKLSIGFIRPIKLEELCKIKTQIMTIIYGASPTSKLFCNVREKMSLCYHCSAEYKHLTSSLIVNSGVESKNISKAQKMIVEEFKKMQAGDFTEDELEKAKLLYKNNLEMKADFIDALETWYKNQIFENSLKSPEDFIKIVNNLTKEDVVAQAQDFAVTTNYIIEGDDK